MTTTNAAHRARRSVPYLAIVLVFLVLLVSVLPAFADPITRSQAEKAVATWLAMDNRPLGADLGRLIKETQSFADDTGNVAYHVVYLDPAGFVIVAADDLVEPVIAFAPEGRYDPSTDNPLGALVTKDVPSRLDDAREAVARAVRAGRPFVATGRRRVARDRWDRLLNSTDASGGIAVQGLSGVSDVRVAPFVLSKWDQMGDRCSGSTTYNHYTPSNYPAGCVATAMAQLMRYWQFPTVGVGTASHYISECGGASYPHPLDGGNGSGGPYVWSEMDLDPCSPDAATREAIGHLVHDAGVAVNMDYCGSGSGADTLQVATALRTTFGYSNAKRAYNLGSNIPSTNLNAMINPNLHAAYPVILGITGTAGGHAVVCDGYGYNTSTMYHHLNLGWSGTATAWYNLPNIDTGYYTFTSIYKCVYNVYASGAGEIIAGRVTDSAGTPISGATVTATWNSTSYSDTTDSSGIYAVAKVNSARTFAVSVTKPGYTFTSQNATTGTSYDGTTTCGNKWPIDFAAAYTAPTTPIVTDDGAFQTGKSQLHASWASFDATSGISEYQYAIGTAPADPGSGYAVAWKSAGTNTQATESGLALQYGQAYYWYVKARNFAGNWSSTGSSDGIAVVQHVYTSIPSAKMLPDGSSVGLDSPAVSAVFGGTFYVSRPGGYAGIRVDRPSAISGLAAGAIVDVGGRILTTADGERYIQGVALVKTGSAQVRPVGLNNRCLGGGDWLYNAASGAGQRGVENGIGTNTIGVFVRAWGKVTSGAGNTCVIDDGSGVGVTLAYPSGTSAPTTGTYVTVAGISSCIRDGGGKLQSCIKVPP